MNEHMQSRLSDVRAWLGTGGNVLDLGIRLYVAKVFFWSGLTKIASWENTVALFEDEYHVPLLPTELAAALGTFGELVFPVLLAAGLASRFAAGSLFLVNLVAVISYWHVLKDLEPALAQHWYWGVLLLVTLSHGPGKLALDGVVWKRWPKLHAA
jgi:putative oxidoreductase